MDPKSFTIIIILTTIVSYLVLRKFFSIAPRYLLYAVLGVLIGLTIGIMFFWPTSKFFGEMGIIIAPYVLGVVVMVLIETFILEGLNIVRYTSRKKQDFIRNF